MSTYHSDEWRELQKAYSMAQLEQNLGVDRVVSIKYGIVGQKDLHDCSIYEMRRIVSALRKDWIKKKGQKHVDD